MKLTKTLGTFSLLGILAISSAFAADATTRQGGGPIAEACRQDVQTLCPGSKPGDGSLKACMRQNHAKVSDGCKAAVKAQRGEHRPTGKQ